MDDDRQMVPFPEGKGKGWKAMYENVCGSRRLLEGNILAHDVFLTEIAREVKPGDRILEVGSGTGVLAYPLTTAGIHVTSLDNDEDVLFMAGINAATVGCEIEFVKGDGFEIPYPADSFRLAYSHGLLEHFTDAGIELLLDEQLRVAPIVVLGVPLDGIKGILFGNERLMSVEEWVDILAKYDRVRGTTYMGDQMLSMTLVRMGAGEIR